MSARWSMMSNMLAAGVIGLGGFMATAVSAQISPGQHVALRSQGYSEIDIKAADALQIAPHFAYYQRWKSCWDQVALQSLPSGDRVSEVRHTAETLCGDEAGYLRASLARELGLPRANRIIGIAEASLSLGYDGIYARLHPAPPKGSANVAGWTVERVRSQRCGAAKTYNSLENTIVAMIIDHGIPEFDFILAGSQGTGLLFDAKHAADVTIKITVPERGPDGSNFGDVQFHLLADPGGAILRITPDQKFIDMMSGARDVLFQDPMNTPFDFHVEGNELAWAAVQRCSSGQ